MTRFLPVLALLVILTTTAPGQIKIDIPAAPADSKIDNLVCVVAPEARCAAVCDTFGWLAIGHRSSHFDAQVSLFRLDAQGKPAATALPLKLPRSPGLARYPIHALSLAFHPKLPLLYVWQDVDLPKKPDPHYAIDLLGSERTGSEQIEHLLIYSLEKPQPELLVGTCSGRAYLFAQPAGGVSVDPAGERLYVSNLRVGDDSDYRATVGSFALAPDGIPLVADGDPKLDRAAHIAAIDKVQNDGKSVMPQRRAPWDHDALPHVWGGSGTGFVHTGRDQVLIGSFHTTALIAWKPDDKQARLHSFQVNAAAYCRFYAVGHPRLPIAYVAALDHQYLLRFEHVDGNFTLVPRQANVAASVTSPAVVLSKANRLAFGSNQRVVAVNLDEQGRFKRECVQAAVPNPRVEALAYSDKFDRLYVAVETSK